MGYVDEKIVKPIKDDPLKAVLPIPGGGDLINAGRDAADMISGKDAKDAAEEAAALQEAAGRDALAFNAEALSQLRADLDPFKTAGTEALPILQGAIDDPSSRVLNNPFFQAMAQDQEQRLLASASARGRTGAGGTQDALTRNLLLLGNQFGQQDISNLMNLSTIGANAAAQTGTAGMQSAQQAGGILGNIANAQAAGVMGAQQASAQGFNNMMNIAGMAMAPFTGGASLFATQGVGGGGGLLGGGSAPVPLPNPQIGIA